MIEDKDVKIAENPTEALWSRVKKEAEALIKMSEDNLIVQKAMLELATNKLNAM
jgi:hypothetical protein